ncbi:MAG: hypothetical protein EZS28_050960, partial [Streblomastix strix]
MLLPFFLCAKQLQRTINPGNASTNGFQLIKNLYGDQNIDTETTSPGSVIVMGQTSPLSGSSLTYSCSSLPVASGEFDQYDSSVTTQTLPSAQFDNKTYSDIVTTNLLLMAPTNDIEWNITLQYEGTYIETQIHIPFGKVSISPASTLTSESVVIRPKIITELLPEQQEEANIG